MLILLAKVRTQIAACADGVLAQLAGSHCLPGKHLPLVRISSKPRPLWHASGC